MTERRKLTPEQEKERAESYARSEALLLNSVREFLEQRPDSEIRLLDEHEDETDDFITKEDISEIPEGVKIPSSNGSEIEDIEEPEEIDYDEIDKQVEGDEELWQATNQGY